MSNETGKRDEVYQKYIQICLWSVARRLIAEDSIIAFHNSKKSRIHYFLKLKIQFGRIKGQIAYIKLNTNVVIALM